MTNPVETPTPAPTEAINQQAVVAEAKAEKLLEKLGQVIKGFAFFVYDASVFTVYFIVATLAIFFNALFVPVVKAFDSVLGIIAKQLVDWANDVGSLRRKK